ncbi:unnamed protein product [Aphanomyces euteiches]|uniref:Microsomal glutathione S-transferase 1 n=1 Tax=Aphanomyces euteiches TaxID=100861 RepID=A0A6G0XS03_9STRA|nr:hypothetical protein Ae201684_002195 [Aphanomyces euteiches]KAH9086729.1 hypothetical protein Ae201684P_000151 [Aphanomyces euteiches]KAH9131754.1 hypothetical protein AeRB84_021683 [Aphanomyces euteiches]
MSKGLDTKVLVGATGVLAIKLYATLMIQGSKRFAAGTRPPEDQILTKFNPTNQRQAYGIFDEAADAKKNDDKKAINARPSVHAVQVDIRWDRIVRNDLENIPIGLLTAWAAVNSGGNVAVNVGAISAFTLFRILHTIAYAKELQPHRARFWSIGVLSVLTLIGNSAFGLISNM